MMTLLAVSGGLLLAIALIVREYQLSRERAARMAAIEQLHASLDIAGKHLRRAREDLYVLRCIMQERGIISDQEFASGRDRLIEAPRRKAEERSAILRSVEVSPLHIVVDEGESVH